MVTNLYKSILKNSPDGYIFHRVYDKVLMQIDIHRIEDVNNSFLKLFELDLDDEPLRQVSDFFKQFDANEAFNWEIYFRNCLSSEYLYTTEFYFHQKEKWISLNSYIVEDYLITFARDISAKKEEAIQKNKLLNYEWKMLSMVAEQSPVSIIVTDIEGNIEYVNKRFCQLTGYSTKELIGCSPRILQSGITSNETYRELWSTISSGYEWQGNFVNRKKNGELYYEAALIAPVMDESGRLFRYIAIKEDITEHIKAKKAMVESSERLAAFLEVGQAIGSTVEMEKLLKIVLRHGVLLLKIDRGVIYFVEEDYIKQAVAYSEFSEESTEVSRSFMLKQVPHIKQCIDQKEVIIINDFNSVTLTKAEKQAVLFNKAQSGLVIPLIVGNKVLAVMLLWSQKKNELLNEANLKACKVLASQASLALKNASLYQEVKTYAEKMANYNIQLTILNDELQIAKNKAELSDCLKSAFLRNMSHEIRTPMNGILGFSELLKSVDLPEDTRQNYLGYVIDSTNQLLKIVDDIINVSRLEAGDVVVKRELTDPVPIIDYIYQKYLPICSSDVELIIENPVMQEDKLLMTERSRLKQIIESLVDNAVKFTKSGTVKFGYSLLENNKIHFFVEDTGIGIPVEKAPLIFNPFYQIDMGENREFGGNGLGLTVASLNVENMESILRFNSEPEKGTCFYFDLPLSDRKDYSSNATSKVLKEDSISSFIILVAEDDDRNYLNLLNLLKNSEAGERLIILRVFDGLEAIKICQKNRDIDLILINTKMFKIDGIQTCRIIKKDNPFVHIIVQTDSVLLEEKKTSIEAGCDFYISKDDKTDKLLNLVYQLLQLPISKK